MSYVKYVRMSCLMFKLIIVISQKTVEHKFQVCLCSDDTVYPISHNKYITFFLIHLGLDWIDGQYMECVGVCLRTTSKGPVRPKKALNKVH